MNLYRAAFLHLAFLILGASSLLSEDDLIVLYQPVITDQVRFNSQGVRLMDPVAILIQERSYAHKEGGTSEDYFTTPQRRSEIPQMLARGDFSDEMKKVVMKGKNPVLWITVRRNQETKLAMHVGMRSRDQDDFDPSIDENFNSEDPENLHDKLEVLQIKKAHPNFDSIRTVLSNEIMRKVGEPVRLDLLIYILDGWARVDGRVSTASGKDPINEEMWGYFELDLTAVLKKDKGRWQVLKHVVAGDITAAIEIPKAFPDVPEALFQRLPPEVTGEIQAQEDDPVERMAFIDGESNFRTGPGTQSQIKFKPVKGTLGSVIERKGNWIRIQLDNGDSGWAHKQNLRSIR